MNRPFASFFIAIIFSAALALASVTFGQEDAAKAAKATDAEASEAEKLVLAFQAPDGTAVEGRLHKTIAFESIAGVLQVPGEKIHGIQFGEDGTTLKLSDGSKITGKIVQKTLPFALFVGEVDVPLELVAAFGEKSQVHKPQKMPGKSPVTPNDQLFEYIVIKGDTLKSVAAAFITTVKEIEEVNPGVKGNNLKPGLMLRIPPLR